MPFRAKTAQVGPNARAADARTQALMREYAERTYMDETVIRQTIHLQNQWDKYRDNLADELELPRPSPRGSTTPR